MTGNGQFLIHTSFEVTLALQFIDVGPIAATRGRKMRFFFTVETKLVTTPTLNMVGC